MTKELVTIEFRYHDKPKGECGTEYRTKRITIGIFDTMEEAVIEGNKAISVLSEKFQVRNNFKIKGLFGNPDRLVTNTCYPTKRIEYFAKITKLEYSDLNDTINETFEAFKRYEEYKNSIQDED